MVAPDVPRTSAAVNQEVDRPATDSKVRASTCAQCETSFNATTCTKHNDGRWKQLCDRCWDHKRSTSVENHSATDSKVRASTGAQRECRTGARVDPGVTQAVAPAFVPAIKFKERRTGQCFKMGNLGLGFYQDGPQTDKTISDERTVTPEWPAIHSARWGEVDFPGRQPRCVDAERALFRRHNQIVAPESQVRGEPLLNYNSSVRVGSAPASAAAPPPSSHQPIPGNKPWELFRSGRIYLASCGSFFRHKLESSSTALCAEHATVGNVSGGATSETANDGITRRVEGPSLPYQEYYASTLWKMFVTYCVKHVAGLARDVELARDMDPATNKSKAGSRRRHPAVFKIPARLINGGGEIRWDLRPYWKALQSLRTAQPEIAVNDLVVSASITIQTFDESGEITPRFRREKLLARCHKHNITDEFLISQLTHVGMLNHSKVVGDLVIAPNYRTIAEHALQAQALKEQEQNDGLVSPGFMGLPLVPSRCIAYGAIVQPPKIDPRFCADLRSPRGDDDEGGENSVNAMIDLDDHSKHIKMVLTGPLAFAHDVGKLMADIDLAKHPVWLCAADWRRFYRQLLKALCELWMQVVAIDPAGFRLDFAVIFGDGSAPAGANNAEDLFLELIYLEFEELIGAAQRDQTWTEADNEHLEAVKAWSARRNARVQASHPTEWKDPQWRTRQERLGILHGFFDDSLIAAHGGPTTTAPTGDSEHADDLRERMNPPKARAGQRWPSSGIFAMLVRAIVFFAQDINLEISAAKMLCGTSDGLTGTLDLDTWNVDTANGVAVHNRRVWWINMVRGHMPVLGKMINLDTKHVHDSTKRIEDLHTSVEATIAFANSDAGMAKFGKPAAPIRTIQRQNGVGFFICQTEPWIRAFLNPQTHALKLLNALYPIELTANRKSGRKSGVGVIPWFTWMIYGTAAQQAMREFVARAREQRGTPFNTLRAVPGANERRVAWIMEDASGKDTGGGGAMYWQPSAPDRMAASFRPWRPDQQGEVGDDVHSTTQETATAVRNLEIAVEHCDGDELDIIECIDSQSTCAILGHHRYHASILRQWVERRANFLRDHPQVRVWTIWNAREHGRIPDGFSNGWTAYEPQGGTVPNIRPTLDTWTGIEWASAALEARGFPTIDWWPTRGPHVEEYWSASVK